MKAARLNTSSLPRSVLVMSAALLVAVATFLTGCSPEVVNPSRVLQSVSVDLASDGAITTVNGSAVFVDEATGESRSTQTDFKPAEVVDDLPVRVSTQYRTGEANGPDLNDLSGFTGRVEIDITVENLTVSAKELSYDAAGQARLPDVLLIPEATRVVPLRGRQQVVVGAVGLHVRPLDRHPLRGRVQRPDEQRQRARLAQLRERGQR